MENLVPKFKKGDSVFVKCWWPLPNTREHVYEGSRIQLEGINGRGEWTGVLEGGIKREIIIPNPPEKYIKLLPQKVI